MPPKIVSCKIRFSVASVRIPFFERSLDNLTNATENRILQAARRLEGRLRRHLTTEALALEVFQLSDSGLALVPRLDILILAVGSRGDVQPFISLARALMAE